MSFISVRNVSKTYKTGEIDIRALSGVDFDIEEGELAVIVGPSGSGKTTLLNLLGGMDTADSGRIIVDDKNICNFNQTEAVRYRRNDIGFVFQFYNLIPNLTAAENIDISSQLCKNAEDSALMLKRVGLENRGTSFPAQLSGGEQQRVAIARALAKKPKLLLCDEPTGALDYTTGKMILKLLQTMCAQEKMTVVIVTHNSALTPMADRVIKLKNGAVDRMIENKSPFSVDDIEW